MLSYGLVGRGGDAIQVLEIAQALRNLGHEVKLIGPQLLQPYAFKNMRNRVRTVLRKFPWWARDLLEFCLNLHTFYLVRRALRHENFDLAFHRVSIYDLVGPRLARYVPVIAYIDAPFPIERNFRKEGYFGHLHKRTMRALGQSVLLIVTVSKASQKYYAELGLPSSKIVVIPNGVSEKLYQLALELAKNGLPFAHGPPWTIGFVGSLSPWHRVDLLLKAFALLEGNKYNLTIVGYGSEYKKLQGLANWLGVEKKVNWLGPVPHEEAIQEMVNFDIAVLPGTLSTGAPIKLFEYAALARPVIAPDLPNLRAWFADDEMRFIEPENPQALAKAILSLCEAPEEARQMGLRAQARVAEYTWEKIVQRILETARVIGKSENQ
ncbi:MAG: glycosyltransferase family 4 protein [Candidatus Bathyarchaeia archaeon]